MAITIKKSDEDIRNECKKLWNQEIDMDWLREFYHSFIKWNREDKRYPDVRTQSKEIGIARITMPWNTIDIEAVLKRFDWIKEKVKEIDDRNKEEYWDRYIWITAATLYCPKNITYKYYQSEEDYIIQYIKIKESGKMIVDYINECIEWFSFDYIAHNLRELFINWDITLDSLIKIVKWSHAKIEKSYTL